MKKIEVIIRPEKLEALKKILTKNVQDIEKLLTNKCKYDMIYT